MRRARTDESGFTLIELLIVVVIIGVLAAIAVPAYLGQQDQAKDAAAKAQLRSAATAQQLYYAKHDGYAGTDDQLKGFGFRQGEQQVTVAKTESGYCMEAPGGGSKTFTITQEDGRPGEGTC